MAEETFTLELWIFPTGYGLLQWYFTGNPEPVSLPLSPRFVTVLSILQLAREKDFASRIFPDLCGYRNAAAIARLYSSIPPDKTAITRYLMDLCKLIAKFPGAIPFVHREPGRGARLLKEIKIAHLPGADGNASTAELRIAVPGTLSQPGR